jgi:single-strand DNA-binding protein
MVNKVFLIGHIAADPDVKATPAGKYVAKMRLATNTYAGKDDEGKARERTEYHNLVAFDKTAEFAGQYVKKGRLVFIDGRLQTSSWEDASGQKRYRTEVVVEEIKFLGARPAEAAEVAA